MAETKSRRERILDALKCRLEGITQNDGYRTNLGHKVLLGEMPRFGPDDPEQVIAILPKEDQIVGEWQEGKVPITWPIDIAVLLKPDLSRPWAIVEAGLVDVKRAIEGPTDRTLGGLLKGGKNNPGGLMRGTTEAFPRHSGSDVVGALVTYACPFWETWGDPEA